MISVLLCVYNGEKHIAKSLESILNQTYNVFEVLIGFNGTTDNSKNIVAKYLDHRIKIFDYNQDKGKAKTLNKLLKEVKGDWCAIQDDDDIWLPKKLETQIEFMSRYDVIGTQCDYINENGDIIGHPLVRCDNDEIAQYSLNGTNQIINTSAIFKTEKAIEVGGWDETIDGIEDYDFWLKLIKAGCRFHNLSQAYVQHRLHANSNFNTKKYDIKSLIEKYK